MRSLVVALGLAVSASPLFAGFVHAEAGLLCLSRLHDGEVLRRVSTAADGTFSLSFIHSVSKTPVIDRYLLRDGVIVQTAEIFHAHGAGLPSIANDLDATGWRHENGSFILDMERLTGPIHLRVQAAYKNTLHNGSTDLPLASLGASVITLAPCTMETDP